MSDSKRLSTKGVKFADSRSGSSRASTTGGSTTSSGHSGSQYTPEYNIGALEMSLRATVRELDDYKKKYDEANERLHKTERLHDAQIKGMELEKQELKDAKKDLEKECHGLRKELESTKKDNSRLLRKLEKIERLDSPSEPSSPDSGKPRRTDSKMSKENERLKARFEPRGDTSSEGSSTKPPPPSSSRAPHRSSGRRPSMSAELSPSQYLVPSLPPTMYSAVQAPVYVTAPVYASVPRSAGGMPSIPMHRPTVEYATYGSAYPQPRENGNYHAYPLPRPQ